VFVELIESLRCPNAHEPSALVASASRVVDRHILDGTLGCPVCGAEFRIADGIARFAAMSHRQERVEPNDEAAMRLAAFLELTDARGFALLCGTWAGHAERLRRLVETPMVFVNAAAGAPGDLAAAVLEVADVLPLAPGAARAAALDDALSMPLIDSVVRAVRPGGRVFGPVRVAMPAGVTEIARDAHAWVAERASDAPTPIVRIGRAKG
jgi:uncharacterized protein YbaR (Trm112 family)